MLRSVAVMAFIAVAAMSCSAPPDKERHQAEGAITAARAAEAALYAPESLRIAETALSGYDAAVAQRDYREALRLALEARDTAYQAVRDASDEKAAARSTAERDADELDALVTRLRRRVAAQAAGRAPAAATARLATLLADGETTLQEARSKLGTQDYRGVSRVVAPVAARLREDAGATLSATSR